MAAALAILDTLRRRHELMPELEELQDDDGSDEDSDEDSDDVALATAVVKAAEGTDAVVDVTRTTTAVTVTPGSDDGRRSAPDHS